MREKRCPSLRDLWISIDPGHHEHEKIRKKVSQHDLFSCHRCLLAWSTFSLTYTGAILVHSMFINLLELSGKAIDIVTYSIPRVITITS